MSGPSTTTPYSFIKRGNLFITPVGPSIAEVPYPTQTLTKHREYSLWVNGHVEQPAFQLDHARMPPSLYQEVRNDLVRYSPVEVTRSAFRRSNHAYVGVIDSKGTPYYFALDSRGMSVREMEIDDDRVWKTFDKLSEQEHATALHKRRLTADREMVDVDAELSIPIVKAYHGTYKPPGHHSSWWRNLHEKKAKTERQPRAERQPRQRAEKQPKPPRATKEQRTQAHLDQYEARLRGRQAIRDKVRGERKQTKPAKPKASNTHIDAWKQKHPGGSVAAMADHPFAKADASSRAGKLYASEMRRIGHILAIDCDEEDLDPPRHDDVGKSLHPAAKWIANELHSGRQVKHENGTHAYRSTKRDDKTGKHEVSHFTVISPGGVKTIHSSAESAGTTAHGHTEAKIKKALPKGGAKDKPVKKTPNKKASSKKVGAGGKPRYNYPNEKKKKKTAKPGGKPGSKQVPLIVAADHDDSKHADPAELANQLGVSVRTLQHAARRMGADGFGKYMRSHLKRFAAKHRLDPDYWSTLYERLHDMEPRSPS